MSKGAILFLTAMVLVVLYKTCESFYTLGKIVQKDHDLTCFIDVSKTKWEVRNCIYEAK